MLGNVNVAAPTLAGLTTNFGLQSLVGKPLAIISDARLSNRPDQAVVVERLLSISAEDAITIDRKHRDPITVTLPTRIVIMSNGLPRLNDASSALASRFIVLRLTKSFYGKEDHSLRDRLLGELPGVLNWALEGAERLAKRGRFIQPESGKEAIEELETLGSPVVAFVRDVCDVKSGLQVSTKTLYEKWVAWCKDNGRDNPGTPQTFGRDLRAAYPGIRVTQPRDDYAGRIRCYEGISYV